MDASHFDALTRSVAHRSNRRRIMRVLAGLGLGGFLMQGSGRPAAATFGKCTLLTCPAGQCNICVVDERSCSCSCGSCSIKGIAGGGAIRSGDGEAHLALFATRTALPEQEGAFVVHGQVRWTDPTWEGTGLSLESVGVTYYGPQPDVEGGREVAGWMTTDQQSGEFPFVLRAVDAGSPGSGQDTVALWVGDAVLEDPVMAESFDPQEPSGFRYAAEGALVSGDLQLLSLASETEESVT